MAEAIRYNLALRLATEWGRPLDQAVIMLAAESMGVVKRANKVVAELRVDNALLPNGGQFNIYTGE
jgi:hypothetical protein